MDDDHQFAYKQTKIPQKNKKHYKLQAREGG
jgi:hypothetical protein